MSSSFSLSNKEFSSHHDDRHTEDGRSLVLAQRETKAVGGLRVLIASILLLSMTIVSTGSYIFVMRAERTKFQESFADDSDKISSALGLSLHRTFEGAATFAINMLSYARDHNQTWPFVTIPDFEARSSRILGLTSAVVIMEFLLVTPETRTEWESYTATHGRGWAEKSIHYLQRNDLFQDVFEARNITNPTYLDFVHDYTAWGVDDPQGLPYNHPGPFLPMWQSAPLIPTSPVYNWDLVTVEENESVLECINSHRISLSKAYHISEPGDSSLDIENEAWADYFSNFLTSGEDPMEPLSDVYYPMIEELLDLPRVRSDANYDPSAHKIAGILSQSVYWRDLIKGILPRGSDGYRVVFESPCNPTFTYEINGPVVKYMGVGDHHDSKYDNMGKQSLLQDLINNQAGRLSAYSHVPLDQDLCPWNVSIYPSQKMEDIFTSNNPIIVSIAGALIFIFVSGVFLCFDTTVERRNQIVMDSAVRSNLVVNSLFPANVRDRLLEQENAKPSPTDGSDTITSSKPIADLFPDATVLFADIAGFTAWSNAREPIEVFRLLEHLFGAFDSIAKKRNVFKIETIGDSYVAVANLPKKLTNHATVMARFASDCIDAMRSVTTALAPELGKGTSELQLRVGIHSGPVTCGVLRNQKSRYQIFGNTVNTAARMESTGKPNQIQVSKATANKIIQSGKANWVSKRTDIVQAKGLGAVETFWVEPWKTSSIGAIGGFNCDDVSLSPSELTV